MTRSNSQRRLKEEALTIFQAGLAAVDPAQAVSQSVTMDSESIVLGRNRELSLPLSDFDRVVALAFGKAGAVMASALEHRLGDRLDGGVAVVKHGHSVATRKVEVMEAGHPVPDAAGMAGAEKVASLAAAATERTLVLCLISGGGSALLPLPAPAITLDDKMATTELLLRAGADVKALNCVRKHMSALKGGQLARLIAPGTVVSLILSDVVGDPLDVIASGPCTPDQSTFQDAAQVLRRFGVWEQLPDAVRGRIGAGVAGEVADTPGRGDPAFARCHNLLVGTNAACLQGCRVQARSLGFEVVDLGGAMEGEAREVAREMIDRVRRETAEARRPTCWLGGGETTVTVTGPGKGGRNQEFALAAALAMQRLDDALVLAAGTDGTDGPTDAAGGVAFGDTVERGARLGLDASRFLAQNDSYEFLNAVGDLMVTGPTGTNVMDVYLALFRGG